MKLPVVMILAVSAASLLADEEAPSPAFDPSYRLPLPSMTPRWTPAESSDFLTGADLNLTAASTAAAAAAAGRNFDLPDQPGFVNELMYRPAVVHITGDLRWEGLMVPLHRLASNPDSQISFGGPKSPTGGGEKHPHAHSRGPDLKPLERLIRFDLKW